MKLSALIVIPARQHSTRLPEKLLRADTGQPLLAHTIATARAALSGAAKDQVWVACDDDALAEVARAAGANVVMVTEPCESGTERIWRALPQLPPAGVILNLQADEPMMPADWIRRCIDHLRTSDGTQVATIAVPIRDKDPALDDPNVTKVVVDHQFNALYFSRAPIPAVRAGGKTPNPRGLRHVGLYAYRAEFLRGYGDLRPSSLEEAECLEQLRFLQAGARMRVIVPDNCNVELRGIDTERDYQCFVEQWRGH